MDVTPLTDDIFESERLSRITTMACKIVERLKFTLKTVCSFKVLNDRLRGARHWKAGRSYSFEGLDSGGRYLNLFIFFSFDNS